MPINWDPVDVHPVKGPDGKFDMPRESLDIIRKHGIGLKGPLATQIGKGHRSLNLALRKYVLHIKLHEPLGIIAHKALHTSDHFFSENLASMPTFDHANPSKGMRPLTRTLTW